jgi:2-polyprenyl-3-methyl-5-hydroxy-6-metoxy-1,4-benzoquinol methylase
MPQRDSVYEQARLRLLDRLIPEGTGLAVDIGCHDGTLTRLLRGHGYTAVGFDIDEDVVVRAANFQPGLDLRVGSVAEANRLGPRQLTLCLEVIEHLDYSEQADFVQAMADGTAPGGCLVISTPGRNSLYSTYERLRWRVAGRSSYDWWDPTHVGVMSSRRLDRLLGRAGFQPRRFAGFHYLPERLCTPFGITRGPLARMGFDLIAVCVRNHQSGAGLSS